MPRVCRSGGNHGTVVPVPLPPLVLVPGLGLGPEAWTRTVVALPASWPVSVRPLPGLGQPAPRGHDVRPDALARELLDRLDPGTPVALAGHSASCQVVAAAARAAPDRVAALVLVGPSTDPRAATWPRLVARWIATAVAEDPGQAPLLVRLYARTGLGSMRRAMDAARRHRLDEELSGVSCPVLVIRGPRDRICPASWAAALAAAGARGTSVTLAAGAHMVPITHGPAVGREVGLFLRSLTEPGADGPTLGTNRP